MAGDLNRVTLIGRLGKDPEKRTFNNGGFMVSFSMATSESWKDKSSGEKQERTQWHQVVIFSEGIAGVAERYLRKGSKCFIEGQLETRKWQDQSGADRYSTEVVVRPYGGQLILLGDRGGGDRDRGDDDHGGDHRDNGKPAGNGGNGRGPAPLDDDIPF